MRKPLGLFSIVLAFALVGSARATTDFDCGSLSAAIKRHGDLDLLLTRARDNAVDSATRTLLKSVLEQAFADISLRRAILAHAVGDIPPLAFVDCRGEAGPFAERLIDTLIGWGRLAHSNQFALIEVLRSLRELPSDPTVLREVMLRQLIQEPAKRARDAEQLERLASLLESDGQSSKYDDELYNLLEPIFRDFQSRKDVLDSAFPGVGFVHSLNPDAPSGSFTYQLLSFSEGAGRLARTGKPALSALAQAASRHLRREPPQVPVE